MFTNIDSTDPKAPDKIMAEYQVDRGGTLEGREIEVSFVRADLTRLPQDQNYFMAPDNGCKPNSQLDILYRHWIATLTVPSLGVNGVVDFYANAEDGDKILGTNTLNFMWESPGPNPPAVDTDRFKVIIFDPQVQTTSGEWKRATKFLVDYRTPLKELPLNAKGQLVGGYRKANYKGQPAIEASFGYGYTDYVTDGDPTSPEATEDTKGVIDLAGELPNRAWLDVSASPTILSISGGESGAVTYVLSETNGVGVTITSEPWVFVYPDGSTGNAGTDADRIRVDAFSTSSWPRWPYLWPDVAQHAISRGWSSVALRYTFAGFDDNGNSVSISHDLTIRISGAVPEFPGSSVPVTFLVLIILTTLLLSHKKPPRSAETRKRR
jgi:hypothetical protein